MRSHRSSLRSSINRWLPAIFLPFQEGVSHPYRGALRLIVKSAVYIYAYLLTLITLPRLDVTCVCSYRAFWNLFVRSVLLERSLGPT